MKKTRFTFAEVGKKLEVSLSSVWRWHLGGVKGKKLKSILVGGRRYVTQAQLDEFLRQDDSGPADKTRQTIAKRKLDSRNV